jgi:hypothetical protein
MMHNQLRGGKKKEYEKVSSTHNANQINKSGGLKVH